MIHDLNELVRICHTVQVMIMTFGDMPPVFKKSTTAPVAPHPNAAAGRNAFDMRQMYPGANGVGVPATYLPYPSASGVGGQQPATSNFPPYPSGSGSGGYSHPMPGGQPGAGGLPYPSAIGGVGMPGNGYVSVFAIRPNSRPKVSNRSTCAIVHLLAH